jgi:hypothetical protein
LREVREKSIVPGPKDPSLSAPASARSNLFFRDSYREMGELKAKRDAAKAALEESKATAREKAFGQKVIECCSEERYLWAVKVNQASDRLRRLVPDHGEQEALSLTRDFKDRPIELCAFPNGSHPSSRL